MSQPDEALRWRLRALRDENGVIAPGGVMRARQQADGMRARQALTASNISPITWTWLGPGNVGGRIRALAIHPTLTSTVFAGSASGGIWKTTNSGSSWFAVDDFMGNLAVTSIVFRPGEPTRLFAATGEGFLNFDGVRGAGIFTSGDGGTTWIQLPSTASNEAFHYVHRLAFSADGSTLLAATWFGMFRSTNLGATWSGPLVDDYLMDVKFISASSTYAVASSFRGKAYYSTDAGLTWALSVGLTGSLFGRVELAVSVSSPHIVYAALDYDNGVIWRSHDYGASYVRQSTPRHLGQGFYDNALWVDPTNANHVISAGVHRYRSTDGGVTFSVMTGDMHVDHHAIVSDPGFDGVSNRRVYFGNDGGVYRIEDIGIDTPINLNNNLGVTQFYGGGGFLGTGVIFGGTQDNGTLIYRPEDGPQAWTTMTGGDGGFVSADHTNPEYMYGERQWLQIFRTSTGTSDPTDVQELTGCNKAAQFRLDDSCTLRTNFISPFLLDPNEPNRLLAGGLFLWRTNDARAATTPTSGPTWATIKAPERPYPEAPFYTPISAIAIAKANSDLIWVAHGAGDRVFKTVNGTSNVPLWLNVGADTLPKREVTSIAIDPRDSSNVYLSFGGFTAHNVWRSSNGGMTWNSIATDLPWAPVHTVAVHPTSTGWLYIGTEIGVFASTDFGQTWSVTNTGPANVPVYQLFWLGTKIVAVTHGRGMFRSSTVFAPFTDETLIAGGTPIRAVHVAELRSRIDALRGRFGLQPYLWTDTVLSGVRVKTAHILEMRAALAVVYSAAGRPQPSYIDPGLTPASTLIRAVHISQLRDAVRGLE